MTETPFGELLKRHREQQGLTQEQLVEKIKEHGGYVSRVQIARLETGKHIPSWDTVKIICKALGVDCKAFIEETAEPAKGRTKKKPKE